LTASAQGYDLPLGSSGWKAVWADSFSPFLNITFYEGTVNGQTAVFISKTTTFTAPPGPGGFPTIPIQFKQTGSSAAEYIVINSESITNSTGTGWTGFKFQVTGGDGSTFDPLLTNASGGGNGFSTSPFVNQSFIPATREFLMSGGVVPNGEPWSPGSGPGELYIDVVPTPSSSGFFTFKETPTPEPAILALFAIGAAFLERRRSAQI